MSRNKPEVRDQRSEISKSISLLLLFLIVAASMALSSCAPADQSASKSPVATNTDANATQISDTVWAATAAIGEDNFDVLPDGVSNDGTNNVMAFSYGVIGGACDTAGGVDAPFYFLSDKPIVHKHKKHSHHGHKHSPNRERGRTRDDDRKHSRR